MSVTQTPHTIDAAPNDMSSLGRDDVTEMSEFSEHLGAVWTALRLHCS